MLQGCNAVTLFNKDVIKVVQGCNKIVTRVKHDSIRMFYDE